MRLGDSYFSIARTQIQSEVDYSKARTYWEKLVEIDESTALAHRVRARILWQYDREWKEAKAAYKRSSELDVTLEIDSGFLEWIANPEECLSQIERKLERADPLSASQQADIGYAFLSSREYDRAIEQANKVRALEPQRTVPGLLWLAYIQTGREEEAIERFFQSESRRNASEEEIITLRESLEKSGTDALWRSILERQLKRGIAILIASTYARLGDTDEELEWLENAWSQPLRGMENAPSSFHWDPLRSDPRFEQLLRKLKLPEEAIQRHLAVH